MRMAALALVSVLAMAACSPSAPSGGGNSGSGGGAGQSASAGGGSGFPQMSTVAYRQEATMQIGAGAPSTEVIIHDGARTRTEMNGPMGNVTSIMNMQTREVVSIMHMGGRTMATRTDLSQMQTSTPTVDVDAMRQQMRSRSHQLGPCSAAGESGTEWTVDPPAGVTTTHQMSMCVTGDGIMIQMKQNGNLVFDTQSLQRGPQDPSQFEVPAGVHVTTVHMPSQASIADAVARARAAAAAAEGAPKP